MEDTVAPAKPSGERSLTDYVAGFVVATRADDIPADVKHLEKRSVIDGLEVAPRLQRFTSILSEDDRAEPTAASTSSRPRPWYMRSR